MERKLWTRRELLVMAGAAGLAVSGAWRPSAGAAPSRYMKAVLASGPVGYWRLGEAEGPYALDVSGNGHRGVYQGSPAFREQGAIRDDADAAVKLDGKRSYVEIADHKDFSQPTSGKGLTVEAWVRPDMLDFAGETGDPYIYWLGKGGPKQWEWALRLYSGKFKDRPNRISAYIFNPEGGLGAGAYFQDQLRAGEWVHVVACFDPGDGDTAVAGVHIYKNGVPRLGPPSAGTLYDNARWRIKPVHGRAPVRLGTCDARSFLAGGLDEVAIYPRVLSATEILEHFKTGQSNPSDQ
jgi:Concanavalin A-like lectin/glucanases superfamily